MNTSLWLDEYRPISIEDFSFDPLLSSQLLTLISQTDMPNLLFSGPSGVGKTSLAEIISKKYVNKSEILELNASDERGIDVIRTKVSEFCQKVSKGTGKIKKIIILDEADMITVDGQNAMRVIMEKSKDTRFIFCCNDIEGISDPIKSRCIVFTFSKSTNYQLIKSIERILKWENVMYDDSGLEALIYCCDGDIRKAINLAYACHRSYNIIDFNTVFKIFNGVQLIYINEIIKNIKKGNISEIINIIKYLEKEGFSNYEIFSAVSKSMEAGFFNR